MYTSDGMSAKTRTICERGKFFIETGTARSFKNFMRDSALRIAKYIPESVLKRIEDLINSGDKETAITLWMKACEVADLEPSRRRKLLIFYVSYFAIGIIALLALLRTL